MSMNDVETKNLEEVVEVETTVELNEENKKAKVIAVAKKAGKIIGTVIVIGGLGYIIGSKVSKGSDCNVSEIIDVTLED